MQYRTNQQHCKQRQSNRPATSQPTNPATNQPTKRSTDNGPTSGRPPSQPQTQAPKQTVTINATAIQPASHKVTNKPTNYSIKPQTNQPNTIQSLGTQPTSFRALSPLGSGGGEPAMVSRKLPVLALSSTPVLVAAWQLCPECLSRGNDFVLHSTALADQREKITPATMEANQCILDATISALPNVVPSIRFLTTAVMQLYTDCGLWDTVIVKDRYAWAIMQAIALRRLISRLRRRNQTSRSNKTQTNQTANKPTTNPLQIKQ